MSWLLVAKAPPPAEPRAARARLPKTNAARLLDELGIGYVLHAYPVSKEHQAADEVARLTGMPLSRVFKTLLAEGDRAGPCFAVIGAASELDLKALARVSGNRSVALAPLTRVQPLTGYVRGGTTALAAKKRFPVFLDEAARALPRIVVSAGQRGLQLELSPEDYARATDAVIAPIARG